MLAKINGLIYNDYIYPIVAGNLVIDTVYHKDDSELYLSLNAVFDKLKNTTTYYKLAVISELLKIFELLYSSFIYLVCGYKKVRLPAQGNAL